ncbi:MAG TPA: carboxylating nicotinate-nucleotide diphosphorylase [Actinomycetes bacterium]|nr:carboxylating nicotinate-nucleotide diphosphorylase [Actinomycetes bacterium]
MSLGATSLRLLRDADLDPSVVVEQVQRALDEDLVYGPDITSLATVQEDQQVTAEFAVRGAGVIAGLPLVAVALDVVVGAERWSLGAAVRDGDSVRAGDVAVSVTAPTRELLTAERTALNFLCHLSGVATLTARWVAAVDGTPVVVRDTRKTTPGLRVLEKYAVRVGGGANHRMGLGDAALVKDNHVLSAGGVAEAVAAVRALDPTIPLEVEVDSLEQLQAAVSAGVTLVLLDNMSVSDLKACVDWVAANGVATKLEASGGLTLEVVRDVAATGVDFVAVGALTHSAGILDVGLDLIEVVSR